VAPPMRRVGAMLVATADVVDQGLRQGLEER